MIAYRKFLPLLFVLFGLLGSMLPYNSVSISGGSPELVEAASEAAPKIKTAWNYTYHYGPIGQMAVILIILLAAFALVVVATRLSRWASIPIALLSLAGLALLLFNHDKSQSGPAPGGLTLAVGMGVGYYLSLLSFAGTLVPGLLGAVVPDAKKGAAVANGQG